MQMPQVSTKIYRTHYRNYVIFYNPKPGDPALSPDYDFHHFDCEDGEDYRQGFGVDVNDCKRQIDYIEYSNQQSQIGLSIAITVLAMTLILYLLYWSL
jgi:hypothetical protein